MVTQTTKLYPDLVDIIMDYYYQLIHTEKLDRVHAEMLIKSFIIFRPIRYLSVSYFLSLED